MSPFEFVVAFYSIVVGLGVAQMLSALSDLLEARRRVRTDWIQTLWALNILILLIHSWWGMWGLKAASSWSYAAFLITVAFLSTTYLLSTLVFPRVDGEEVIDLRAHYENVRTIFLYFVAAALLFSVLLNHALFGSPFLSPFVAVPAGCFVAATAGAHVRNRAYQGFLAILMLGMEVLIMLTDTTRIQ